MWKKLFTLILASTFCLGAFATEAQIKSAIEAKLGNKVTSVTKSPYLGLYEIFADGQIFYTDEKISLIFSGVLIDGESMKNVTAERLQKLTAIKFSELPLEYAIKQVRGNGKRLLATFEDPNCGFCKRLAKDMVKLTDVTIYTFLYPILSQDSLDKSNQIWCSKNRLTAWNDWIIDAKAPTGKGNCDTSAVKKTVELGKKLAINGTPTLIFANGERVPGAMSVTDLDAKLTAAEKQMNQTSADHKPK